MRIRLFGTVVTLRIPKRISPKFAKVILLVITLIFVVLLVTKEKVIFDEPKLLREDNLHENFDRKLEVNNNLQRESPLARNGRHVREAEPRVLGAIGKKLQETIEVDDSANQIRMKVPMDLAHSRKAAIQQVAKEYIRTQNRPPDHTYNINLTHSDALSLDRTLVDTRPPICKQFKYSLKSGMTATVVIPFYNEALSMLLRTVHSVLNRTPLKYLDEVILVDDKSTHQYLHSKLEDYVNLLPRVRLIRNDIRRGLVVSRMNGYRASKSHIVVFLDAHAEVNEGWLEPLIDELERHPQSVLQPFIDGIDAMSLQYTTPNIIHKGSFSWDLRYTWLRTTDHETARAIETGYPMFTPTLVGCAIAVRRDYFDHIGTFDENLRVWGGENLELGFRVWMCGGRVTTVTCSRVGHVFKEFPYTFDGNKEEIVHKNLIRVAETWMDGMRKYFYASTRSYDFKRAVLDAEEEKGLQIRKDLRARLKCRNFEWYMNNIIPEVEAPPMTAQYYGEIMNLRTRACFEVLPDYYIGLTYFCYDHKIIPENNFYIDNNNLLVYRDKCVGIKPPSPLLQLVECPQDPATFESFGQWFSDHKGVTYGKLMVRIKNANQATQMFCIVQVTNILEIHNKQQMPQLSNCEPSDFMTWSFTYKFDWTQVPKEALAS